MEPIYLVYLLLNLSRKENSKSGIILTLRKKETKEVHLHRAQVVDESKVLMIKCGKKNITYLNFIN